jgi:DNA-binding MarR family transcriptional regulator
MPPFEIGKIDEVIHGRLRLGVMAYLADAEVASFNELKGVLETTQGNLSIQLRKLEDAGYIAIDKSFLNRKPLTRARITPEGRAAFAAYLEAIGRLIG